MPQKRSAKKKLSRKEARELDIQIGFLEGVLRREPGYVEALQLLGDHYTRRGKFEAGLRVDEELSRIASSDPLVFYNLACSYSLTGQVDRAATALQRAIGLGYRDFKWLAKDPDLDQLREHPVFRQIESQIHKIKIA